jgi:acylglycerol lipase
MTAPQPHPNKKSRRKKITLVVVGALVASWLVYKIGAERGTQAAVVSNIGCPSTGLAKAREISCEGWDIGTGVAGYVWKAPNPRAVVLLQHGWADYSQRYVNGGAQLIPHLVANGISVYAFDMRGSGHSPGKRGLTNVEDAIADHLAARAKLREQPYPVFLMGHSLGGLVTATSLLRNQENVAGAVLLAPALKYDIGAGMRTLVRVGGFLIPTLPLPAPETPPEGTLTRDRSAEQRLHADPMFGKAGLPWIVASGGATVSYNNMSMYPQIKVPVLAVHGTEDKATDPTGSREFINLVASSDKTLLALPGARHSFLDDSDGAVSRDQIIAWIAKRTGR